MDLSFDTAELRRLCEKKRTARSRLGSTLADCLADRLADLLAARSLPDLPPVVRYEVLDPIAGLIRVQLSDELWLHLQANHPTARLVQGAAAWQHIVRLKVVDIVKSDG